MSDGEQAPARRQPTDEEIRTVVPRERGGREIKVGIFVILGILSAIAVLYTLTDPATLRGRYLLVTALEDAGGIRRGDPVQMRGVNIGRINGFELTGGQVNIRLEIEGEWEIPTDSYTRLTGQGLFGGRTMEVIPGDATTMVEGWDTIPSVGSEGSLLSSAETLGTQATDVLTHLNQLLAEPTITSVRTTTSELQALVTELRAIAQVQRQQIGALTESLTRSAEGLETASRSAPAVATAVARADSALLVLNRTSTTLDRAAGSLNEILARVEGGEGTLGRLTTDDSLYVSLNRAADAIALLAEDIRLNPRRYLSIQIF